MTPAPSFLALRPISPLLLPHGAPHGTPTPVLSVNIVLVILLTTGYVTGDEPSRERAGERDDPAHGNRDQLHQQGAGRAGEVSRNLAALALLGITAL